MSWLRRIASSARPFILGTGGKIFTIRHESLGIPRRLFIFSKRSAGGRLHREPLPRRHLRLPTAKRPSQTLSINVVCPGLSPGQNNAPSVCSRAKPISKEINQSSSHDRNPQQAHFGFGGWMWPDFAATNQSWFNQHSNSPLALAIRRISPPPRGILVLDRGEWGKQREGVLSRLSVPGSLTIETRCAGSKEAPPSRLILLSQPKRRSLLILNCVLPALGARRAPRAR
jgi:hypothetical protein